MLVNWAAQRQSIGGWLYIPSKAFKPDLACTSNKQMNAFRTVSDLYISARAGAPLKACRPSYCAVGHHISPQL